MNPHKVTARQLRQCFPSPQAERWGNRLIAKTRAEFERKPRRWVKLPPPPLFVKLLVLPSWRGTSAL